MQTWEAITSRRNVRSFADRPIPAADLDQILEAGADLGRRHCSRHRLTGVVEQLPGEERHVPAAATIRRRPAADRVRRSQELGQATMAALAAADLASEPPRASSSIAARNLLGSPEQG